MKRPDMSWRPTTGQLTGTALALVCLLAGFWIGWQHRSSTDPQTVTPSVPANMRTKNVIILPTPTTAPTTTATTGTSTATTATAPVAPLPPRSVVKVAVLNAGSRSGVAVQIAVSIVQLGYPTPVTGNVTLPPSLVPTQSPAIAPATTAPTGTAATAPHTATGVTTPARTAPTSPTTSTATTPTAPTVPQIVYYRPGGEGIGARLATDLGITDIAPIPASAALQAAAPTAQLIVVVGNP
jgi:hypothetical protein